MPTEITGTEVSTDTLRIASPYVPSTPTSTGTEGDLAWDENFLYVCVAANTWARTGISTAWSTNLIK